MEGDIGELLAPGSVDRVGEAGMIGVELRAIRQDLIGEPVQVSDSSREPGDRIGCNNSQCISHLEMSIRQRLESTWAILVLAAGNDLEVSGLLTQRVAGPGHVSLLGVDLHYELVVSRSAFRGTRFNMDQIDLVILSQ